MKRWRLCIMICLCLLALSSPRLLAEDKLSLRVNGELLGTDIAPVIENGRALVPIRVISEALGFSVAWDQKQSSVTIIGDQRHLIMTINQLTATVDGQVVRLDTAARIIDGRTMVPLRFAGEALGAEVAWDGASRTVSAYRPIPITLSEVEQTASQISVTISGDAPLRFAKQIQANPSRLLLDLPFAKTKQETQTIPVNKGGIIAARSSQRADQPTTARIVFDLDGQADAIKVQPSADGRQITVSAPYRVTQVVNQTTGSGEALAFTFDGPVQMIRSANETALRTGVIKEDSVNFRPGPGMSYPPSTMLNRGTKASVLAVQSGWVNVRLSDGRSGWVADSLFDIDPASPPTTEVVNTNTGTGQRVEVLLRGAQSILPSFNRLPQSAVERVALEPVAGAVPMARLTLVFKESVRYKVALDNNQLTVQLSNNNTLLTVIPDVKGSGTQLKIGLSRPSQARVSHLTNPDRLLIEVDDCELGDLPSTIPVNDGLMKAIRIRNEGRGVVIVADLEYYVGHNLRSPAVTSQIEINLTSAGLRGKLVVLDPGHGGSDPGAVGVTKFYEKTGTLDIALRLQALLEKAGARVLLTRTDDSYIPLSTRADLANNGQADLFLSIHHNSFTRADANGIEVIYSSGDERKRLADNVQRELVAALGLRNRGAIARPEIYVTRETAMPSALAEIGFISNPAEEALIKDAPFRQKAANALFNGLSQYFARN